MHKLSHLQLEEIKLPAGQEWMDATAAWRFVRLHSGAAYWLGGGHTRPLAAGEVVVVAPRGEGLIRASQIGDVVLQGFNFTPDMLCGFFTVSERHFFEMRGGGSPGDVQFLPSTHPVARQFADSVAATIKAGDLPGRVEALRIVAVIFEAEMARHQPPAPGTTSALERFKKIIGQMPETELINHAPEELARLAGCSPRHFNRLFMQHFGVSARARQTELRLLKSRQLLLNSDEKIVHVALESGYRNLSLFNALFKKRFGMTPSQWRKKSLKPANKMRRLVPLVILAVWLLPALARAQETNAAPAVAKTNAPITFRVDTYEVEGNTILTQEIVEPIFKKYVGAAVTFDTIRQALADLQLAYRARGFVTVSVALPQQQLTNGVVRVKITEGRLVDVVVKNNKHFSTENILRALPSARTNTLLNGLVFQQQLDRANASGDRQIYPVIAPGPEPGTSVLELRVKDRLPFHLHMELNNYSTPGTPDLRLNLSGVYNNLWQRGHQFGAQYSMTPEALKDGGTDYVAPYDRPLIASYSAFYRMPLSPLNGYPREYAVTDFGYDEATHRFRPPPMAGGAELIIYASRSYSDSSQQLGTQTLTPSVIPTNGAIQISDSTYNRTLSPNENIGARVSKPLPNLGKVSSSVSFGFDFKNYRSLLQQNRTFQAMLYVPTFGSSGPPFTQFPSPPTFSSRSVFTSLEYLPFTLDWSGTISDKFGNTDFDVSQSYNPGLIGRKSDFQDVAGSTNIDGNYYIVTASVTRDQKIWHDWGIKLHADGQWANQALINNEQYANGGNAGPRGFLDGSLYSDGGWRISIEPHSPWINIGLVDGDMPMLVRFSIFTDYADGFSYRRTTPSAGFNGNPWSTGFTFSSAIGSVWDFRVVCGWILPGLKPGSASVPSYDEAGTMHVSFSLNAQL